MSLIPIPEEHERLGYNVRDYLHADKERRPQNLAYRSLMAWSLAWSLSSIPGYSARKWNF